MAVAVAAASSTLLVLGPAHAAAKKYALVGPGGWNLVRELEPFPEEDASQPQAGFALFHVDAGVLSVVVTVKRATPNAELPVRVIQNQIEELVPGDCHTVDGVLRTNGSGNGTLRWKNPSQDPQRR